MRRARHDRRLLGGLALVLVLSVVPAADALTDGTLTCALTGGNSITVTMTVASQGAVNPTQGEYFSLTGAWDDASLTPFIPIYGGIVDDPNFDLTGGFTRVGFTGFPLANSPFGIWPLPIHVQFRLEPDATTPGGAYTGRWADNYGRTGAMSCVVTP